MYPMSVSLFIRLLPYVGIAVGGQVALQLMQEITSTRGGTGIVSVLLWSLLAYGAHAELLLGTNRHKADDYKYIFGFALRTTGLGLFIVVPAIISSIVVFAHTAGSPDDVALNPLSVAVTAVTLAISFVVVFSFFGTVLPAYVLDKGRGVGAALQRGKSQFIWTASRILIGPLPIYLAGILVLRGMSNTRPSQFVMLDVNHIPNLMAVAQFIGSHVIQTFGTVMVAWVLSNAYLRAEASTE
jgi:hypothetical protein